MYSLCKEYNEIQPFEFKLYSNPLCTTCSRDSLRERARSERLRNLSERLRWVRGPGVRRSHILPYPSLIHHIPIIPPLIPLPSTPITTPPAQLQLLRPISSSKDDPQSSGSSSQRRRPTTARGSIVPVPLLLSHS